jgi:hypothetical protein
VKNPAWGEMTDKNLINISKVILPSFYTVVATNITLDNVTYPLEIKFSLISSKLTMTGGRA